jgi:pimeloyl-ACP methyl ester carboxylesterase
MLVPALAAGFAVLQALAAPAPEVRHLIYVHGRIVQTEQSRRPISPEFGPYELDLILDAFRERGFEVHSEVRSRSATVSESADRVVAQIRELLASGVRPGSITVVGASMGASIAFRAAARLQDPGVRFAVLGACLGPNLREVEAEEGRPPKGILLAIREASDELGGTCPAWPVDAATGAELSAREIVLDTGLEHGFLYRPLPEWVEPIVAWASARD